MKKILILGATGELGIKLLNFCKKKNINIFAATCYNKSKNLSLLKKKYNIKNTFTLSNLESQQNFLIFLKLNKLDLVYFLDYGSKSLLYADLFLDNNTKSIIAIANKEMIIAGNKILMDKIYKSKNLFIPLDSEHFSLLNSNLLNKDIKKIYITASGGPFFFKKNLNLEKVSFNKVISHPKWKMGINNSIDSSNFVNKVLEIFELSSIFSVDLNKIDFIVSRNAYVHSLILYNNNTTTLNCFHTDMIIPLINPLSLIFKKHYLLKSKDYFFDIDNFKFQMFTDNRFKIKKYLTSFKKLSHEQQIVFMLLNNKAHDLYINNNLKYNEIINFVVNNLKKIGKSKTMKNIKLYFSL